MQRLARCFLPRFLSRLLLLLLLAVGVMRVACAMDTAPPAMLLDLAVIDRETGSLLQVYWSGGQRWVAGVPGHKYALRVNNRSGGRVLAVVSVDGVNAVSGENAAWDQIGYVLGSRERFDVLGWRESTSQVADFVFGDLEDSYAVRTGRSGNVGVIGLAVFRERPASPPVALSRGNGRPSADAAAPPQAEKAATPEAAAGGSATAPTERAAGVARFGDRAPGPLGTAHGAREDSIVGTTEFERARPVPDSLITIRYDRRERLVAMGIIPDGRRPQPFPESQGDGFVPDPPAPVR
jgi:hypothetical protein